MRKKILDTAFLDEVKSRKLDAEYTSGEEMDAPAKEMMIALENQFPNTFLKTFKPFNSSISAGPLTAAHCGIVPFVLAL